MSQSLSLLSYNIRYDNPADGANSWPHRQEQVATLLQRQQPDLIGLQEVLHHQLVDLAAALPAYDWIGVGRDDGQQAGEYAPIFYRRARLTLQESGHFWLSSTPTIAGSLGWDAHCVRVATWASFRDRESNATFVHLNTHLDHRGMTAQLESVKLLKDFLNRQPQTEPTLITGDFNCTPSSATYRALTSGDGDDAPLLCDAMHASITPHAGPNATFTTNFADPLQEKIDYIFLHVGAGAKQDTTVQRHAVIDEKFNNFYPSDHLPVLVELQQAQ